MRAKGRPTPELMRRLHQGKADLRAQRTRMALKEKIRMLLELQRIYWPLLKRHRPLASWERPWEVDP